MASLTTLAALAAAQAPLLSLLAILRLPAIPPPLPPSDMLPLAQAIISDRSLCSTHRPGVNLDHCEAIYSAGTGTETLAAVLARSDERFLRHTHEFWVGRYNNSSCFIMNLRDPVRRLLSGFRKRPFGTFTSPEYRNTWRSLSDFVQALANVSHPAHLLARKLESDSNNHKVYLLPKPSAMKAVPWKLRSYHNWPRTYDAFVASQLFLLEGFSCSTMEIHFLCTDESFQSDLRHMLHLLDAKAVLLSLHGNGSAARHPASLKNSSAVMRLLANASGMPHMTHAVDEFTVDEVHLQLSAAEVAYVRNELYPADTLLWRRVCHPDSSASEPSG